MPGYLALVSSMRSKPADLAGRPERDCGRTDLALPAGHFPQDPEHQLLTPGVRMLQQVADLGLRGPLLGQFRRDPTSPGTLIAARCPARYSAFL